MFVLAFWEGLHWTYIILAALIASAVILGIARLIVWWFDRRWARQDVMVATSYAQWGDKASYDLTMAAIIWSGSAEEDNKDRRLCFQRLKEEINKGRLRPLNLRGVKANPGTTVRTKDLKSWFERKKLM